MPSPPPRRDATPGTATEHVPVAASASSPPPLSPQQEAFAEVVGRLLAAHLRWQAADVARKSKPAAQATVPPAPRDD